METGQPSAELGKRLFGNRVCTQHPCQVNVVQLAAVHNGLKGGSRALFTFSQNLAISERYKKGPLQLNPMHHLPQNLISVEPPREVT